MLAVLPTASLAARPGLQSAATFDSSCAVGEQPFMAGYDPVSHETYVPNLDSGNITVLSGTCTVAGTITLPSGAGPAAAVFDPSDNDMFVTDYLLNQIYVISGLKVVNTIQNYPTGVALFLDEPWAIAYVPADYSGYGGTIWVTNLGEQGGGYYIEGFYTPTNQSFELDFGYGLNDPAYSIAYDPDDGFLWWATPSTDSISAINYLLWTQTFSFPTVLTFPVGSFPANLAVDQSNGFVYVANEHSNNVTVLDGAVTDLGKLIGTISGFDEPWAVAWDQSKLSMYVTNSGSGKVFVVGGSTGLSIVKRYSTAYDSEPDGLSYDAANGKMYVTGFYDNVVYVLS